MGNGLKDLNLGHNLAHLKEKICKVIPSYAKKYVQTHYHRNTTKLLKVPKIQ